MARVTVEDCIDKVTNRFDLVMYASQRSRQLSAGAPLTIDRDRDKNPVVALREIASETVSISDLEESLIQEMQTYLPSDDPEEELLELFAEEQAFAGQSFKEDEIKDMEIDGEDLAAFEEAIREEVTSEE